MPIALAACRLMMNSNLVDCTIQFFAEILGIFGVAGRPPWMRASCWALHRL
jgi:hypothetical protein